MDKSLYQSWEDFLNPEKMRVHLISASIYIAGFESLKETIITRPKEFFTNGWSEDDGDIDEIIPGRIMALQLMCAIALGSEDKSKYYYDEFKKRYKGGND